jgi:hypothetical protein
MHASLRLAFCRRKHAVMARTLGDFTGAEAIDVGRAGPALLRRGQRGQSRASREEGEEKCPSKMGPARHAQKSLENCLHDSIP